MEKLLQELKDIYPMRAVVLGRELTKKFEEYIRGTPAQLRQHFEKRAFRGEFVVLIGEETEAADTVLEARVGSKPAAE